MLSGFKRFLLRGNVVDLAVAVVIGAAFTAVVGAFTEAFLTPLIGVLVGAEGLFTDKFFEVGGTRFPWGQFINAAFVFTLTAAVVYFFVVVPVNRCRTASRRRRTSRRQLGSARSACQRFPWPPGAAPFAPRNWRAVLPPPGEPRALLHNLQSAPVMVRRALVVVPLAVPRPRRQLSIEVGRHVIPPCLLFTVPPAVTCLIAGLLRQQLTHGRLSSSTAGGCQHR